MNIDSYLLKHHISIILFVASPTIVIELAQWVAICENKC